MAWSCIDGSIEPKHAKSQVQRFWCERERGGFLFAYYCPLAVLPEAPSCLLLRKRRRLKGRRRSKPNRPLRRSGELLLSKSPSTLLWCVLLHPNPIFAFLWRSRCSLISDCHEIQDQIVSLTPTLARPSCWTCLWRFCAFMIGSRLKNDCHQVVPRAYSSRMVSREQRS